MEAKKKLLPPHPNPLPHWGRGDKKWEILFFLSLVDKIISAKKSRPRIRINIQGATNPVNTISDEIIAQLRPLVGLKLSIARRAADMRIFHFGPIQAAENGTVGEYALHIQCPWRIEGPQGIVTGSCDLCEPGEINGDIDWDTWDYEKNENLQDRLIGNLLSNYDPQTRSFINENDKLVVEAVSADIYGGAAIMLSGGYRLVLFTAGTRGEDWRIFSPKTSEPHFVIVGGRIEQNT